MIFAVAPFAGAWIEIEPGGKRMMWFESLPSRERGLKYFAVERHNLRCMSLPSRERGLKLHAWGIWNPVIAVAPFAGAWIEM